MVLLIHRRVLLAYLICLTFFSLSRQDIYGEGARNTGYKYFKNYTYLEYDHHPQNWCIVQDKNGIIYVGNNAGVLVFDGVTWQVVEVPNMVVLSMAIGKDGRIYIGGKDEFGYLTPNPKGSLKYVSLTDYLDEKYKKFSNVWDTVATKEGVYFRTARLLFRWNYKKIDMYQEGVYGFLSLCNGKPWLQKSKVGLLEIQKDSSPHLPGSEVLGTKRIYMFVPYDSGNKSRRFLLGTRSNGLLIYEAETITSFGTEADDYLKKNNISHGIRLTTGDYAVATLKGGLVILDTRGHVKYIFNKTRGLQDNYVNFVLEDNLGNLWLALSKGISRLEYRSPLYHYDDRSGLEGMVLTVTRYKDDLFVGTDQGVFVLGSYDEKFTHAAGIGICWALLSTEQAILAAASNGVFRLDTPDGIPRKMYEAHAFGMSSSKMFPGYTWCASKKGLVALGTKNNRFCVEYTYEEIKKDIRNIVEDPAGYLWLVTSEGDILKVDFPGGISRPLVTPFRREERLHEGELFMTVVEGHVIFASRKGMFRYDERNNSFIPDPVLGKEFAYGPHAKPVFRIAQDRNRNIWFHSESRNYRAVPGPGKTFVIKEGPFGRIPIIQMNAIFSETDNSSIWFAGVSGLIRYDSTVKIKWEQGFNALIRGVFINETTSVMGNNENSKRESTPVPLISYKDRNISFRCGAPFFERESDSMFSYKLDGYSKNWSEWTSESRKHYTNLDAGQYTFRVRAKNIYGIISREDTFKFRVLPPWYRTWWAFALYVIVLLLLFIFAVNWRSRRLLREKERLEQVVEERTHEIRDKNNQLEQQTHQLKDQSEKLKEMDKIKSRFFANISHEFRTPLTLIMSPLEQLLSRTRDNEQKKNYRIMLRNSQQLLTLINQLLDLSRIDSGKMKLQAACQDIVPLIERALASFQSLADQKKISLEFHYREKEILLYFDAGKMEEVMYNLLSNAVKFTPPGGQITVAASIEDEGIARISVKDTGTGIFEAHLPNIFDRFFQAGKSKDKTEQGTGIGLSLAKEIITLHRGKIDVHSREGQGTEFVVHLPMGRDHLSADDIVDDAGTTPEGNRVKEIAAMYMEPEDEADSIPGESDTGDGLAAEAQKTVILVVEDNRDMRKHIRDILEPGYSVIEAENGKEGIAKAKEMMPDLIVSDIMMPGVDGYELCRVLKSDIRTSHIPIVMLTAKVSEKSVLRGLETGADDYVTKPFNALMLEARIKNLIELRRQLQLKIQREKMLLPSEISVSNQDDQFLKEFQAVIEKNLDDEDFNIDILSKKLLISRSGLFKKIQALTGETPNQFIQSYRLERGAQLLRENFGNVTEVAMAIGFSSPQYFAKLFKERFHQTPKAYQASESKNT